MALPAPAEQRPLYLRPGPPSLHHLISLHPSLPNLCPQLRSASQSPHIPALPQSPFSAWPGDVSGPSVVSLLPSFLDQYGGQAVELEQHMRPTHESCSLSSRIHVIYPFRQKYLTPLRL